jgi:uncharacterized protein (DUF1800 family)
MDDPALSAAIAANRFGLGARPGELARVGEDARGWLTAQLSGGAPQLRGATLRGSADILSQALKLRHERREARAAAEAANAAVVMKVAQLYLPIYVDETTARIGEALTSERPFIEHLTYFWTNHFAVSVDKVSVFGIAGSFEREAIRPHVLGNFTDLLLASTQHPAMLLYLDNQTSIGPNSQLAQRAARRGGERRFGINENLAREILELHTLGVAGGYAQADVTSFAKVITGWSIGADRGPLAGGGVPGQFVFREQMHEPGAQTVLGKRYAEGGMEQGVAVLRDLAQRPATAHFIATKLARHFIADEPPSEAVDALARTFHESGGNLPSVYRALIGLKQSWAQALAKFKTPGEYIISSLRGLDVPSQYADKARTSFALLGQRIYAPGSPAGWPDRSADWDGPSSIMKRIEWADALGQKMGAHHDAAQLAPQWLGGVMSASTHTSISRAASASQALTLLLTAPEFMRR